MIFQTNIGNIGNVISHNIWKDRANSKIKLSMAAHFLYLKPKTIRNNRRRRERGQRIETARFGEIESYRFH